MLISGAGRVGGQLMCRPPWRTLMTGLFRLELDRLEHHRLVRQLRGAGREFVRAEHEREDVGVLLTAQSARRVLRHRNANPLEEVADGQTDRKSTRLNSSHITISYAVFCLKKK